MVHRTRRRGFSLLELLVVIFIVALAATLMIPAIQQARESARRMHCKNNLKQIGLALHSYDSSFGRYPSGFIGVDAQGNSEVTAPTGWGWAAMILPQMGQDDLFRHINFSASILDPSNNYAQRAGVPSYRCPSDPGSNDCDLLAKDGKSVLASVARANYVGNFGIGSVSYCQNLSGMGMQCNNSFGVPGSGIFFHNSSITTAAVLDGTSNTIMVSERAAKGDVNSTSAATWLGTIPEALEGLTRNLGSVRTIPSLALDHGTGFTSAHAATVEALMADGHVRDISDRIEFGVLMAMASRDGGTDTSKYQVNSFNFAIYPPSYSQSAVDPNNNPNTAFAASKPPSKPATASNATRQFISKMSVLRRNARPSWVPVRRQMPAALASSRPFADLFSPMASVPLRFGILATIGSSRPTRSIVSPHHTGGDPDEEQHYLVPFPDGTHASWGGFTPDSVGPLTIRYDFRPYNGSANNITPGQQARAVDALNMWAEATCNKLVFVQDTGAPDDDIIIIGTGFIGAAGCGTDPGILGCGGGLLSDHTIFGGVAWQNQDFAWDEVLGNGDPAGTFDYFTVVAQETGHALGLGHPDDIGGPGCCGENIMNGLYGGEQTGASALDIDHIQSLYGHDCDGGGPDPDPDPDPGLPPGWIQAD